MTLNVAFSPPVIAHRGARKVAPENTLSALRLAKEQGLGWVEVDAKLTMDGVPILMHDDTLDRTTDATGFVSDASWKMIQMLDCGSWFDPQFAGEKIPRLTDVLQMVLESGLNVIVELKPCPRRAQATTMVTLIEMAKLWPEGDRLPIISSFDIESLVTAKQLLPHWPRLLLLAAWCEDWKTQMERAQASLIALRDDFITLERIQKILEKQKTIIAYTIDDPTRAKELLGWGVKAVISDNPREVMEKI